MGKDTVLVQLRVSHYEMAVMLEVLTPSDVEKIFVSFISREGIEKIKGAIRKREDAQTAKKS